MNKIKENNDTKISVLPLEFFPRRILNSLWSVFTIKFQIILSRDGINQNTGGIKIKPINLLIQFNDKLKLVDGSKDENRFAIIFN